MKISKWQAAAAGVVAIALVGSGTTAASAAVGDPLNPQPAGSAAEGSKGGFFLYSGDTGEPVDSDGTRVYTKSEAVIASASATDLDAEINPAATRPVSGAEAFTNVYAFLSDKNPADVAGGINTWNAYHVDAAAGPNGGTLQPNLTLDSLNSGPGGIADDIAAGGSYWYGIAYTTGNGVIVKGAIYREITIQAGTGDYTVTPSVLEVGAVEVAPAITTQPTSAAKFVGEDAVFTAAASGTPAPTVQWESSTNGTDWADVSGATNATLTVPAVTLAQSGNQYRAKFTNSAGNATTNSVQLTVSAAIVEPTDAANAATKKTIAAPVDGKVTIEGVAAGTYTAYAWSTPTNLGSVTVGASGVATITVPAELQDGAQHTFALLQSNNEIVAWGAVVVDAPEFPLTSSTALTADVTNSGKFALEGVNTAVNLTPIAAIKRGATTAPVALGAFTVTDDRDNLVGWNLNATVTEFTTAAGDVIPNTALGLAPKKVGEAVEGITARPTAKVAGDDWTSTLVAEGAANSNTVEAGTQFDADLTFKAPAQAKKGTYTSTLTLTLSSK